MFVAWLYKVLSFPQRIGCRLVSRSEPAAALPGPRVTNITNSFQSATKMFYGHHHGLATILRSVKIESFLCAQHKNSLSD